MKRCTIIVITIALIIQSLSLITGYTLVIPLSDADKIESDYGKLKLNDKTNVLESLDFSKGHWKAYLIIDPSDFNDLNVSIKKVTCLKTEDISLLQKMKQKWRFRYTGGDMATVVSRILIFQDSKLVFESGIVLDNYREGLQSENFGWLEPVELNVLSKCCKQFNRVYWPIIFI